MFLLQIFSKDFFFSNYEGSKKCWFPWQPTKSGTQVSIEHLNFKYTVSQIKLRYLNSFIQFRVLMHLPHCMHQDTSSIHKTLSCHYSLHRPILLSNSSPKKVTMANKSNLRCLKAAKVLRAPKLGSK